MKLKNDRQIFFSMYTFNDDCFLFFLLTWKNILDLNLCIKTLEVKGFVLIWGQYKKFNMDYLFQPELYM